MSDLAKVRITGKGRPINEKTRIVKHKIENAILHFDFLYRNIRNLTEWIEGRPLVSVEFHYGGNVKPAVEIARRLFGYSQASGGKVYYYDGVMMKWNGEKKETRIWFSKMSDGVYIMTEEDWNYIRDYVLNDLLEPEKQQVSITVRDIRGRKDVFELSDLVGDNRKYIPGTIAEHWYTRCIHFERRG